MVKNGSGWHNESRRHSEAARGSHRSSYYDKGSLIRYTDGIDDWRVDELFRKIQDKHNIKTGDIDPLFHFELDNAIKRGITKRELIRRIDQYYVNMKKP